MDTINFLSENPNIFLLVVALVSLLIGSFLNVVIYRLPRMIENEWNLECREYLSLKTQENDIHHLSLTLPFSHCPHCQRTLKPWHNIPVISYIVLMGKCAYCKGKISPRYPFVEALSCIVSVYIALHFGVSLQTVGALIFTWISIALIFIDLDFHLLPDQLTFLMIGTGLLLSLWNVFCIPTDAIIGMIGGYLIFAITQWIFKFATGKTGMGEGDYKFLAGLGAFLGWQMIPIIVLLASVSGILFAVIGMAIKQQFKSVPLPFGPYLAVAGWISLIWGPEILSMYIHAIH